MVCGGIAADGEARDEVWKSQSETTARDDAMVYFENRDFKDHLYDQLHIDKEAKLIVGKRFADAYWRSVGRLFDGMDRRIQPGVRDQPDFGDGPKEWPGIQRGNIRGVGDPS